jgi:hypothetical protein
MIRKITTSIRPVTANMISGRKFSGLRLRNFLADWSGASEVLFAEASSESSLVVWFCKNLRTFEVRFL